MNYEVVEEDDEINSVLWVGNLDNKVTEAMVYELFLQAGPVKNIHFPKGPDGTPHKGYCFVQFYHNSSVPYTMELMQGATMFGKKLKLQPRPGSIHRKIMDQKIAEKRQEILLQQQQTQFLTQQPQPWFGPPQAVTAPQLAQIQNMVIYQNQMFQPYSTPGGPAGAVPPGHPQNANQFPAVAFPSHMGPQIMQIQIQQQQQHLQQQQQQAHPQSPPQQQSPRHFPQQQQQQPPPPQQHLSYSYISSPTHRIPNAVHSSVTPSHPQALNGTNFTARGIPRGVMRQHRPNQPMALTNGHIVNGNRLSFQPPPPRHGAPPPPILPPPPTTPHQQPIQLISPIYPPQLLSPEQPFPAAAAVPATTAPVPTEMQHFFRRPAPPHPPLVASPAAAALGLPNGYQNIQIYHY